MPLFPVHVTLGEHDGLDENPWNRTDGCYSIPDDEPETQLSTSKPRDPSFHKRSQTTAGHPLHTSIPSSINEVRDAFGRGTSLDLHETRPSLRRIINASRQTFEGDRPAGDNSKCPNGISEREGKKQGDAEVIVHQVQPGDSLPGIALKYDISLAVLRSANKLWTSDSIHLRQVLYIPLQAIAATTTKSVPTSPRSRTSLLSSFHSSPDIGNQSPSCMRRSTSDCTASIDSDTAITQASMSRTISSATTATVRRVPLSELSFFPPPTSALLSPNPTRLRRRAEERAPSLSKFSTVALPASSFPHFSESRRTPTFGLTSFLNGAKDEIIGRLSFDSTRGSSDASEEHNMELNVVSSRNRTHGTGNCSDGERDQIHYAVARPKGTSMDISIISEREGITLNTPRKPKVIQTVQLQPSPKMEIPLRSGTDKSKAVDGRGLTVMRTGAN